MERSEYDKRKLCDTCWSERKAKRLVSQGKANAQCAYCGAYGFTPDFAVPDPWICRACLTWDGTRLPCERCKAVVPIYAAGVSPRGRRCCWACFQKDEAEWGWQKEWWGEYEMVRSVLVRARYEKDAGYPLPHYVAQPLVGEALDVYCLEPIHSAPGLIGMLRMGKRQPLDGITTESLLQGICRLEIANISNTWGVVSETTLLLDWASLSSRLQTQSVQPAPLNQRRAIDLD
jgi:hypothetical protein